MIECDYQSDYLISVFVNSNEVFSYMLYRVDFSQNNNEALANVFSVFVENWYWNSLLSIREIAQLSVASSSYFSDLREYLVDARIDHVPVRRLSY